MPRRSRIGDAYRHSWAVRLAALAVGAAAVSYDLYGPYLGLGFRLQIGVVVLALLYALARGDRRTVGIAWPEPNVRWWLRITLITGSIFCVVVVGVAAVLYATGDLPPVVPIDDAASWLWHACALAPLLEEPIYRLALCAPLVAIIGTWPTIVVSGAVFAFLHHRYGNLSPDNALAGLLLGWAYLRSGSLALPIVLHAIGNALVFVALYFVAPLVL
jgi:uncharacterized protein